MWCGSVQGASGDVELVSWPHVSVGALHGLGERAPGNTSVRLALNSRFCDCRHAGRVPVLFVDSKLGERRD